jgi:hypothetical protein
MLYTSRIARSCSPRASKALLIGTVVGIIVDVGVQLLIPGSSIVEIMVALVTGILSGIAVSVRIHSTVAKQCAG